jgi:hypothetical protein
MPMTAPKPDKAFWKAVAENHYAPPSGHELMALTDELDSYLGSEDPELRDEIAIETLTHWITGGYYRPDQIRELLRRWTANLQHGIGENGTTSVLLRSFSALMLSIIAYHDWKTDFLGDEEIAALLDAAIEYCEAEQDVRGYEEPYGWLHSAAHTADLLKFLARNPKTDESGQRRVLMAIAGKVTAPRTLVFTYSEYDRLGYVVLDVAKRGDLDSASYMSWIERLVAVKAEETTAERNVYHAMYQNTKHFIRAAYFILAHQQDESPLDGLDEVQRLLFEASRHFRI